MELKGKVHEIGEIIIVTDKFQKRELIVEYAENPQYPEFIKFETHQDKCDLLDEFVVGQPVEVHFNIKGKPYVNKAGVKVLFNNLVIWKVKSDGAGAATTTGTAAPSNASSSDGDEDLPF